MGWADILAIANVILAACIVVVQARCAIKMRGHQFLWLKVASSLLGAYWFCLYLFVVFADPNDYNTITFSQVFIRPAFTMTLGLMLAGAIFRIRSGGCDK